jgi:hypothetical protein
MLNLAIRAWGIVLRSASVVPDSAGTHHIRHPVKYLKHQ